MGRTRSCLFLAAANHTGTALRRAPASYLGVGHIPRIEDHGMKQLIWAIGGLSTATAAWILYSQTYRRRPVAAARAAERLQQAWADHRTQV